MGMGGHWLCEKKTGGEEIQNQFGEGAAALKKNGEAKSWPAAWFFFCAGRSEKNQKVWGAPPASLSLSMGVGRLCFGSA